MNPPLPLGLLNQTARSRHENADFTTTNFSDTQNSESLKLEKTAKLDTKASCGKLIPLPLGLV